MFEADLNIRKGVNFMKYFIICLSCFVFTITSVFAVKSGSGLGTSTSRPFNHNQPEKKSMVNFKNPSNKFDSLGALHNEAMEYVRKQLKVGAPVGEVFKSVDNFIASKGIKFPTTTEEFFARGLRPFMIQLMKTDDPAGFLYVNGRISKRAAMSYSIILEKCLNGYDKGDQSDLIAFENAMIAKDPSTSAPEKELLLVGAAICRYSTEYVTANLGEETSGGGGVANGRDIVKADFAGAISGGIGGAFAGSVVLPIVGSVPGYVAGAMGGGIAGSATEWIMSFW